MKKLIWLYFIVIMSSYKLLNKFMSSWVNGFRKCTHFVFIKTLLDCETHFFTIPFHNSFFGKYACSLSSWQLDEKIETTLKWEGFQFSPLTLGKQQIRLSSKKSNSSFNKPFGTFAGIKVQYTPWNNWTLLY